MKKISLYKKSKTGKTRVWTAYTEGANFVTEFGELEGKQTKSVKKCVPKNVGRANATTAAEQAIAEMEAEIKQQLETGYYREVPSDTDDDSKEEQFAKCIETGMFPTNFAPCKPINDTPFGIPVNAPAEVLATRLAEYYAQRKRNGHCIIGVVNAKGSPFIYSRGMENISHIGYIIPEITREIGKIPKSSMVIFEVTFIKKSDKMESTKSVASVIRTKDPKKTTERYAEYSTQGNFLCHALDTMYWKGKPTCRMTHLERFDFMKSQDFKIDPLITGWQKAIPEYQKQGWEGLVLRKSDETSYLEYSFDGKPNRAGSWKFKFMKSEDFLVVGASLGKGGRHAGLLASFEIAQYTDKVLTSYGNVGPGTLTHEELKQLTADIKSGKTKYPFGVEIEYLSRLEETNKVQFGQIQRIRTADDKPYSEYVSE